MSITGAKSISHNGRSAYRKLSIELWDNSGIARRIEQVSNDLLHLNQGTIYPALVRLQQRGWITSHWGESDNKRRAKFYELTRVGRRHLAAEIEKWERVSWVVSRLLTEEA